MASISKIRYTNVIYENGNKRYNDEIFKMAGHNTAILLENGGGKTVFIQAALQAVLPHAELGERKAKETFILDDAAHIAIEWIISDKPRRYAVTAVTLYQHNNELKSYKYAYEYGIDDKNSIEHLPFTQQEYNGSLRASGKGEIRDYYTRMAREHMLAQYFETTKAYHEYIEEHFKIIADEWRSITTINGEEGGVDAFFGGCKTTSDLVEKLLLPTIEQGLVGSGSAEFATTFESQREHFKKHKQLERSIKESQKIKSEIEAYVKGYSSYDTKAKAYESKKQDAKALWEIVSGKEEELNVSLKKLKQEEEEAQKTSSMLDQQAALIDLTLAKNKYEEAKLTYEKEDEFYQNEKRLKAAKEERRHILKLASFKHQIEEAKAQMKLATQQLQALDQDAEAQDLKEQLEENKSYLKGYFSNQLETIEKDRVQKELEKERHLTDEKKMLEEEVAIREKMNILQQNASKLEGRLENHQITMDKIKHTILAQSDYEDVDVQNATWQTRIAVIEENRLNLKATLKDNEAKQQSLKGQTEEKIKRRTQCLEQISSLTTKIDQLEEAAEKVLSLVKVALPSLYSLSSIYAKPQQVLDHLEEQIVKYEREKENALLMERQHSRFIESYEAHEYFTSEPLLESWVNKWYSTFSFLQTGTAFLQAIEDPAKRQEAMENAKWAQLVIVADGQEDKLLLKLTEQKDKLTSPVGVMSLSEAKKAIDEGLQEEAVVYPKLWEQVMLPASFEKHKKESASLLQEAVNLRKEKEASLRLMEETKAKVKSFLEDYPHEEYASWRQENERLKGEQAQLLRDLENIKQEEEMLDTKNKVIGEQILQEDGEARLLVSYVEKANEYLHLAKESETFEEQRRSYVNAYADEEKALANLMRQLKDLKEALDDLKDEENRLIAERNRLKDDVLYMEVSECEASYCNETISYLKERYQQLKDALSNKQKGRNEIENTLKEAKKKLKDNEKYYNQELAEMDMLQEVPAFKLEHEEELTVLNKHLQQLKKSVELLAKQAAGAKTEFDKKEQSYHSKKEEYEKHYEMVERYIEDCTQAKKELKANKRKLKEKKTYLEEQTNHIHKEMTLILDSKHQMELKDQLYGFCSPEVEASLLSEAEDVIYKLEVMTTQMLTALEKLLAEKQIAYKKIMERREAFKVFCQKEISDSKLKNMAINGMSQKDNYEDLVKWQENMVERISATINILERDLMDKDKTISQFMIHLYTYLRTVRTELEEIPKKTRVKTEEGWKTIYEFDIPSWQEDEGKEKIRNHIYALLDEMESDIFKNEYGEEDTQKIKKYVKEQFQLKQLLRIVMGNDMIKVKCRKVSSITSISSQKFSWETSTKWSGGEKWSKNMALYLGILNYLAEKKQNINSDDNKVSRVVILDNPFGKASSGHVLEPVFFIAKQIGFQIIALTAHAEGDFIRKYFPIVYSCKLRATLDQRTNVFTKEQEIQKAYFIDHDPVALSILGSSNQISLF